MKITSREQAIEKLGEVGATCWDAGNLCPAIQVGAVLYEFIHTPQPVEMYTGETLLDAAFASHPEWRKEQSEATHKFMETVRDLILARRAEMLRGTGSDDFTHEVAGRLSALPNPARSAVELIALVREHIEANRPVLELELSRVNAENERLRSEYNKIWDALRKSEDESSLRLATCSPQSVDDSDKYGILVQDGCVALAHRLQRGWVIEYYISGSNAIIDPARIFKVTSQPRGPLKVPCEEEISGGSRRYTQLSARYFRCGAEFAIDWIKKANGAK